jgi:hypothetical protein
MSIINSDGLNTNWQLNVLRGLQKVVDELNDNFNVNLTGPLGPLPVTSSISVALAVDQFQVAVIPKIISSGNDSLTLIPDIITSISIASVGTDNVLVTFDGGTTLVRLAPGTTVNMDAGGVGSRYTTNIFGYDTVSFPGAQALITYNYV